MSPSQTDSQPPPSGEAEPTIVLDNTSVFYGEVVGLSGVDLTIRPGITGIIGPNGSGKTTLMRVLTGMMRPREGTVRLLGADPFEDATTRARTGFVPATECFFENLSGARNLEIALLARGHTGREAKAKAREGLALIGLSQDGWRRYSVWSRGMRQRLKLGLALSADVDVVLLDEPFLGVDPPNRHALRQHILAIAERGRTVLVSSHVLHEVEALTDQVGILAHGRLLGHGPVRQLLDELRSRHPHRIRIRSSEPRKLVKALLGLPHIRQVEFLGDQEVQVVTHEPDRAYRELPRLVAETEVLVRGVSTQDDSLEALFAHVTEAGARRL